MGILGSGETSRRRLPANVVGPMTDLPLPALPEEHADVFVPKGATKYQITEVNQYGVDRLFNFFDANGEELFTCTKRSKCNKCGRWLHELFNPLTHTSDSTGIPKEYRCMNTV